MDDVLPTVLVADDDPAQRRLIRLGLEPRGFQVIEASNGREAVDLVRERSPDLVLLDLRMPVLDGLGFLAEVDARALEMPVMVVSGVDDVSEAAQAFKLGAVDYVPKPLTSFELVEQALRNALSRRDLARKARKVEGRYHTLVENVPMTVFLMDSQRSFLFVSRHLEAMLGESPQSVLHKPDWLVNRAYVQDREKLERLLCATLTHQDKPRSGECRLLKSGGGMAYCLLKVIPLRDDPSQEPLAEGVILDISDRVALEKFLVQREKLKTLGSIAQGLAHEIRNPLMSIGGFARRLRDKYPEAHEAEIIFSEAKRLEDLLARTLNYLTPVKIKTETCPVGQTVRDAMGVLSCEADARGVAVRLDLGPETAQVQEDPELMTQVLINLVRQILGQTPEGGSLSVSASESEKHVSLVIAATSPPEAEGSAVSYLPFDHSDAESGLPFARRMLGLMGGSLEIETRDGQTLVTVRLPKKRERL